MKVIVKQSLVSCICLSSCHGALADCCFCANTSWTYFDVGTCFHVPEYFIESFVDSLGDLPVLETLSLLSRLL